ncbi:family 16 glycosylhydrolase [Sungkyunkwania multivorans]|uniref:Family 16 glycosylhydrolase n=1 Tax=Sungkyunkwania multivorans TaxID=1173618 RepID=A0ABW3CZG1_9FLAO
MKRLSFIAVALCFTFASCESELTEPLDEKNITIETLSEEIPEPDISEPEVVAVHERSARVGPWSDIISENFSSNSNIDDNWIRTHGRYDYNSDLCYYVRWSPRLETLDGRQCLRLAAWKNGNTYRSGHVKSRKKFYPRRNEDIWVGASIKLLAKDGAGYKGFNDTYGAWPAFWTVNEDPGVWPTQGEIDMMEGYSFGGSARFARNLFYGTQTGNNLLDNRLERRYEVSEGWHTYSMLWRNRNGAVDCHIYLDGQWLGVYWSGSDNDLNMEAFKDHNLILNLNIGDKHGIFNNSQINIFSTMNMYVDWVSVRRRDNNL